MGPIIVPSISIIVGLYSLLAATLWLLQPGALGLVTPNPLLPSLHSALTVFATSLLLFGIHMRLTRSRVGVALSITGLLMVAALGISSASGYVVSYGGKQFLVPVTSSIGDYPILLILLIPAIASIGFLSLFRRIAPWALMLGGAALFFATGFLALQTATVTPILLNLVAIGFFLAGNKQYHQEAFRY